jgi:flagellar biosynthetic protein FliP
MRSQLPNAKLLWAGFCALLLMAFWALPAHAQSTNPQAAISPLTKAAATSQLLPGVPAVQVKTRPDGSQDYSVTLQILAIMTALTLLPSFLLMMTSFTRITIVLAILRQALGLQTTPSNQVLMGLSLFLTIFIMQPVFTQVNEQALQPYLSQQIASAAALENASKPFITSC